MNNIIEIFDLTFKYPKAEKSTLDNLSFSIASGEFVFLVGSNGCGKSTLFKLIMSLIKPTQGKIIKQKNIRIAYISQNIYQSLFMDLTVAENLTLAHIPLKSREKIAKYLASYHQKLPSYFNQPVKLLSGGEKQALAMAIKLYHIPDLLLLDEPTSALDPEAEKSLMELTNKK
ncbi:MAG: ABC transporter ATP-binding protein, partial [Rickettsiaceae bacterium]|nr:ABC transporter ATP-binding protein [Rickettsiaceae bacterium]